MTRARRMALLAGAVVVAVVAFVLLKPSDEKAKPADQPHRAARTGTTQIASPPPIRNIKVSGGKAVGGVQRLEFAKGETVEFSVASDVADEVHVHGYDLMKDVKPGHPVTFSFPAKIDGEFEVELEGRGKQIASLRVEP